MKYSILILLFLLKFHTYAACLDWGPSTKIGELDERLINEASGIIISKTFKDRLYHINDSGDGPYFYQSSINGTGSKKISITDFHPIDVEDMTYGNCGNKKCIIIADTGDNLQVRDSIKLVFIEEKETFNSKSVTPLKTINATYPDGPHNVEGVAMHPNGDIYIISKEMDRINRKAKKAEVFVLPKEDIENYTSGKISLTYLGSLNFPKILANFNVWGKIVTSFDISPDGLNILILTYEAIIELPIDLSTRLLPDLDSFISGTDYTILKAMNLPQQEAITYLLSGKSFIYNTEYHSNSGKVPILKHQCK